jgi:hypothetical protein
VYKFFPIDLLVGGDNASIKRLPATCGTEYTINHVLLGKEKAQTTGTEYKSNSPLPKLIGFVPTIDWFLILGKCVEIPIAILWKGTRFKILPKVLVRDHVILEESISFCVGMTTNKFHRSKHPTSKCPHLWAATSNLISRSQILGHFTLITTIKEQPRFVEACYAQ